MPWAPASVLRTLSFPETQPFPDHPNPVLRGRGREEEGRAVRFGSASKHPKNAGGVRPNGDHQERGNRLPARGTRGLLLASDGLSFTIGGILLHMSTHQDSSYGVNGTYLARLPRAFREMMKCLAQCPTQAIRGQDRSSCGWD